MKPPIIVLLAFGLTFGGRSLYLFAQEPRTEPSRADLDLSSRQLLSESMQREVQLRMKVMALEAELKALKAEKPAVEK